MSLVVWTHFRLVRKRGEGLPPTQNLFLLFSIFKYDHGKNQMFLFCNNTSSHLQAKAGEPWLISQALHYKGRLSLIVGGINISK